MAPKSKLNFLEYFQVSHGAGSTLEGSHNNAALTALRTLANTGLDTVTGDNKETSG